MKLPRAKLQNIAFLKDLSGRSRCGCRRPGCGISALRSTPGHQTERYFSDLLDATEFEANVRVTWLQPGHPRGLPQRGCLGGPSPVYRLSGFCQAGRCPGFPAQCPVGPGHFPVPQFSCSGLFMEEVL